MLQCSDYFHLWVNGNFGEFSTEGLHNSDSGLLVQHTGVTTQGQSVLLKVCNLLCSLWSLAFAFWLSLKKLVDSGSSRSTEEVTPLDMVSQVVILHM